MMNGKRWWWTIRLIITIIGLRRSGWIIWRRINHTILHIF